MKDLVIVYLLPCYLGLHLLRFVCTITKGKKSFWILFTMLSCLVKFSSIESSSNVYGLLVMSSKQHTIHIFNVHTTSMCVYVYFKSVINMEGISDSSFLCSTAKQNES